MSQSTAQVLSSIYQQALDIVFPPRCAGCQTWSKELFCAACLAGITPIKPPFCVICGIPFDPAAFSAAECADCRDNRYHAAPAFKALRSVYTFENGLRHAVHRFKYHDKVALAPKLAGLMHDFLMRQPTAPPRIPVERLKLLIPVPLHPWRRYRRGYNQSALLAQELSRLISVPPGEVLRRVRHTVPQVELSAGERARNVAGAFAVDKRELQKAQIASGPVLLIDDVCTTGATLQECAGVLKENGVQEIYALTLARQL